MSDRETTLSDLYNDRWLAHTLLFAHRHPEASGECHKAIVGDIYAPDPRRMIEGFRGIAKSTLLEEAAVLKACFREFHNMVIVGASYSRAVDRLAAVKREFEVNRFLQAVFGNLQGNVWQEGKIVLSSNICIQALGRDQSMLGIKFESWRPDAFLIDDVEDPEEVRTDQDREKTWDWFLKTFLPSLDHPLYSWGRVLGTRRGNGSLPERLEKAGWPASKYPLYYLGEDGRRSATWPGKFPLPVVEVIERQYRGDMHTFMQEYMCEPVSVADRVFRQEMFVTEPRLPSWHAVYAMIDPARTTGPQSATTGWAVWSWLGPKLIVWAAGAEALKPDQIVDLVFTILQEFDPVWLRVEEDGLEEWLRQPIRTEAAKRHVSLANVGGIRAPRGKIQFIQGLQPYYSAREVIHARPLPELENQLLDFPTGRIDAPNALAYALPTRPAAAVYEGFGEDNILPEIMPVANRPLYLAANGTRTLLTAALCQFIDGQLIVYRDWIEERVGDDPISWIHGEASAFGDTGHMVERETAFDDWRENLKMPGRVRSWERQSVNWVVPPEHRNEWNNVGLMQAIRQLPAAVSTGAAPDKGRAVLADRLSRLVRGAAAVVVGSEARWICRAFSGGYCRAVGKRGLEAYAEEGPYRVLMEGLESFAGQIAGVREKTAGMTGNVAVNRYGQSYVSAMPQRRGYGHRS